MERPSSSDDDEHLDTYPSGEATLLPRVFQDIHLGSVTEDSGSATESASNDDEYVLNDYVSPQRQENSTYTSRPLTDERAVPPPTMNEFKEESKDGRSLPNTTTTTTSRSSSTTNNTNNTNSTNSTNTNSARGRQPKKNSKVKKKRTTGRSSSKGRKKSVARKKKNKSKKKKKKKKKTGKGKAKTTAKRRPFDDIAYAAADMWTTASASASSSIDQKRSSSSATETNSPALFSHLELSYQPGPIGVTFAWNHNALIVMAIPAAARNNIAIIPAAVDHNRKQNQYPPIGARLSAINQISIVNKTFQETVEMLEVYQIQDRVLGFDILLKMNDLIEERKLNVLSKKNMGADILKLPKIARPSSTDGGKTREYQQSRKVNEEARPSSAGHDDLDRINKQNGGWLEEKKDETKADAKSIVVVPENKVTKKKKKSKKGSAAIIAADKETDEAEKGDPFHGPIQSQLEQRLSTFFNTIFLKVTNMTYYYDNRKRLGQKKFHMKEAKQNPVSNQWDANIWTLEYENETGGMISKKTWLGQTSKKFQALRLCERGVYKRDRGEFEPMPIVPYEPKETHFEILIVSEEFTHIDHKTRVRNVYETIMNELYQHVNPFVTGVGIPPKSNDKKDENSNDDGKDSDSNSNNRGRSISPTRPNSRGRSKKKKKKKRRSSSSSPDHKTKEQLRIELLEKNRKIVPYSKRKYISTIGIHVTNDLPQYKFLDIDFTIICKTPSQWNPAKYNPSLSERFGRGHLLPGVLGLNDHVVVNKADIKMLSRAPPADLDENATTNERMHQKGGPPLFPDVRGKRKVGTRIGHFYFGLSAKTKEMMNTHRKDLAKHAAKAALAEADAAMKEDDDPILSMATGGGGSAGKNGTAKPKRRGSTLAAIVNSDSKDKLTATQQFHLNIKIQTVACKKLQRIFRRSRIPKMIRQRLLEHRSSTNISRNYRGYKGRLYYQELYKICTIASIQIQSTYRMLVGKRIFEEFKRVRTEAALRIQPIVRGWFGRQFVAWKKANDNLGTTMNKIVRGYLARCKFKRLLAKHFHQTVVIPSTVIIQCMVRSSMARIIMKQLKHEKWIREVAIPSSIQIQKRIRGMIIRERARIQKLRLKSSIIIQRMIRGKIARIKYVAVQLRALKMIKIVILQRNVRKKLAIILTQQRREIRYHLRIRIPACIKVQSKFRTHRAKQKIIQVRRVQHASLKIQCFYRGVVGRRLMLVEWDRMRREYKDRLATRLQSEFRAYQARKKFYLLKQVWIAQRIAAATIIQAGWKGHMAVKRVQTKMLRRKAERVWTDLTWCEDEDGAILDDMKDVEEEKSTIQKLKKHYFKNVEHLKDLRWEMKRRLAEVEQELDDMTEEDIEHGMFLVIRLFCSLFY